MSAAVRSGARVGVVDRWVQRRGPGEGQPRQLGGVVGQEPAGRSVSASAVVPGLQVSRALCEGGEGGDRIEEVDVIARHAVEVFAGELQPKTSGESAGPMTVAVDDVRIPLIASVVQNRTRQLGIVSPGTSIDVVRSHRRPDVIDDTHLGVNIYGGAEMVFDAIDGHPIAARGAQHVYGLLAADEIGGFGQSAVLIGVQRYNGDQTQLLVDAQGFGETAHHIGGLEVLVLKVDETLRATNDLFVGMGDAPLAVRSERITGPAAGIGSQDVHVLTAAGGRVGK